MLEFDKAIFNFLTSVGGVYRRYSDDMAIICPLANKEQVIKEMELQVQKLKLSIQPKKTQVFHFKKTKNGLVCGQSFEDGVNWNKNFQYLGFEFDGQIISLKSSTLSGYYRKMKRTIRRAKHFTNKDYGTHAGKLFKRRILKKYSYKGANRRRKWVWNEEIEGFVKTEHFDWGNFIAYSKKASKVMGDNVIKKQTKQHWKKLNEELRN